jgi:hypothetical protein
MTPNEFAAKVSESTEHERLQVFLLQRVAGYLNVIQWGVGLCAFFLFLLVISRH